MSREYHLKELKEALDPSHPAHVIPPPLATSEKVLDVGCGAGQTLIAAYPDRICFGIDIDLDALKLGQSLTQKVRFCQGKAELQPFRSQRFDFVFSRVALPLTNIPAALSEMSRVLKNGGRLWVTVHRMSMRWRRAREGTWKAKLFFVYVAANSLLFHCIGRQMTLLGRSECFQTEGGMRRALERHGFGDIEMVKRGELFLITARRNVTRSSSERGWDGENDQKSLQAFAKWFL